VLSIVCFLPDSNLEGKEDAVHINVLDEDLVSDDHVGTCKHVIPCAVLL
jgi:hypothetical protein